MTWLFAFGPLAFLVIFGLILMQQVVAQIEAVLP